MPGGSSHLGSDPESYPTSISGADADSDPVTHTPSFTVAHSGSQGFGYIMGITVTCRNRCAHDAPRAPIKHYIS